ncbi:YoaK family protein [Streptococcus koreensis]|uniref:YoaK family protein n=1 Tax=Streptococcus koreensis TaxID=2382163 RepID=UPI003CF67495
MKKLRREFHSRSKAFACLLTMCAGFSDAYTFIERGGTLAAGQTGNVVFLSVGLIGHEIADVEVKLATMLAFMIGIFLMTVFQRLFSHSVWRLSTLVPLVLTTLVAGFLPKEVPNVLIVPFFGLSLGIVAISFGEVDSYAYNHSFMTGNLKKTMVAYGNFVRERKMEFFWESLFMTSLIGSFVGGAILSTFLIQYYGLRTIWFVSLVLTLFLSYRAIQYVRRDI